MTTFLLILTLSAVSSDGGQAIQTIGPFPTSEACQAAGLLWLRNKPETWARASAVCVQVGAK